MEKKNEKLRSVSSGGNKEFQRYVDSYSQKIKLRVGELTRGEWFQSVAHEIDTAKAMVVSSVPLQRLY